MIKYLIDLGVDEVVFNWLIKVGRLVENEDVCVALTEFDSTIKEVQRYILKYGNDIKISMHRKEKFCTSSKTCPAGEKFFYINPKGYVSPCSWIKKMDSSFTTDNTLKDKHFLDIITSDEIQEFNEIKNKRHERFNTGCPAICKERNGTYFSEDPLLEKREIIKKEANKEVSLV